MASSLTAIIALLGVALGGKPIVLNGTTEGALFPDVVVLRKLEAEGIQFDRPYSKLPSGFGLAFLTDPWGTTIELTEGLRDL